MKKFGVSFEKTLLLLEIVIKGFMFFVLVFFFADIFANNVLMAEFSYGISLVSKRREILDSGIIFSAVFFLIFPIFNVGNYLKTQNVKIINDFKRKCKIDFVFFFMGFIGLASWGRSETIFDVWVIIGSFFALLSIVLIIRISIPNIINR